MILEIKSDQNKYIKLAKSLKVKKYRDKEGLFVFEGCKNCYESIKSKATILHVFISKDLYSKNPPDFIKEIENKNADIFVIPDNIFNDISSETTPEGVLFIMKKPEYTFENFLRANSQVVLILDRIQDPGNLGAILRTAIAFEISFVLLGKGTVDLFSPKVVHSSKGLLFNIPVIEDADLSEIIPVLLKSGFSVIGAASRGKEDISGLNIKYPLALIIGNEAKGIDAEILKLCTTTVKIPISAKVDSLNAGVAAGILIHEIKRRK